MVTLSKLEIAAKMALLRIAPMNSLLAISDEYHRVEKSCRGTSMYDVGVKDTRTTMSSGATKNTMINRWITF
jgi:hypothetical protein